MQHRAPTLYRHELPADPRQLRTTLGRVENDLVSADAETLRRVLLLVGALANQWARRAVWHNGAPMIMDIEQLPDRVRLEAFSHAVLPSGFWREVGEAVAPGLATKWGGERRIRSGVWFEVAEDRLTM